MIKKMSRILCGLLALALSVCAIPMSASAEGEAPDFSAYTNVALVGTPIAETVWGYGTNDATLNRHIRNINDGYVYTNASGAANDNAYSTAQSYNLVSGYKQNTYKNFAGYKFDTAQTIDTIVVYYLTGQYKELPTPLKLYYKTDYTADDFYLIEKNPNNNQAVKNAYYTFAPELAFDAADATLVGTYEVTSNSKTYKHTVIKLAQPISAKAFALSFTNAPMVLEIEMYNTSAAQDITLPFGSTGAQIRTNQEDAELKDLRFISALPADIYDANISELGTILVRKDQLTAAGKTTADITVDLASSDELIVKKLQATYLCNINLDAVNDEDYADYLGCYTFTTTITGISIFDREYVCVAYYIDAEGVAHYGEAKTACVNDGTL